MGDRSDRHGNQGDFRRWGRWIALSAAALALCAGGACLFVFNPAGSGMYPPCPFHALTGLDCPGCGTLRALHQLLHGNVKGAFFYNPLAVLLLPPTAYGLLVQGCQFVGIRQPPTVFIPARWIWALLGVILAYWVLRNIPAYPFSLLAPS
jgi:hypothetical protein